MPTSRTSPVVALLIVVTLAAVGLLTLAAIDLGSVLAWASVPIPVLLAGGAWYHAAKATRRGDELSAAALLGWCVTANVYVSVLAGLLSR